MSNNAQFTLYGHETGQNMWKICYVLEELELTHNEVFMDFSRQEQKSAAYRKLNPNGKIPTLVDHGNEDFVIWESNAVLKYLCNEYDKEGRLTVQDAKEQYQLDQWLFFQASGQGVYFGQAQWFMTWHPEKLPSAIDRYKNEIRRVLSVLEDIFNERDWLVGNKPTIADISFIRYTEFATTQLLGDELDFAAEYPKTAAWHRRLMERPAVAKVNSYLAVDLPRPPQLNVY